MLVSLGVLSEKRMTVLAVSPSSRLTPSRSPMASSTSCIAEKGLPADVVELVVECDEHGHEGLPVDPALVAGVQWLTCALFQSGDELGVDGA